MLGFWSFSRLELVFFYPVIAISAFWLASNKSPWPQKIATFTVVLIGAIITIWDPRQIYTLVRPGERVWFVTMALLLVAAIRAKSTLMERRKGIVHAIGIFCTLLFINCIYINATKASKVVREARTVLATVPDSASVCPVYVDLPIYGQIGFGLHLTSYHKGYSPTIFDTEYSAVRYKAKPNYESKVGRLNFAAISRYDYALIWCRNRKTKQTVNALMKRYGWTVESKTTFCDLYKNGTPMSAPHLQGMKPTSITAPISCD